MSTTDLTTTPETLQMATQAATMALGKAALLDQRMPAPDRNVVRAWAQALHRSLVTPAEAADAVLEHYRQPSPWPIMPGNVIDLVHSARRTRRERADVQHTRAQLAARRADPPRLPQRYDGIAAAELAAELAGAAFTVLPRWPETTCPWCDAHPGKPCTIAIAGKIRERETSHPSRLEAAEND